ncbi:Hypothetical predicted protein [Olea europaea subsp. europaea]|uniref:Secreted protein n=1 Tax=Olea europaea subsp. europaea TaxID=158383 RepID=A0A8S0V1Q9_OLEEU|nr:Hypothetical predicted protein [Olea europaea subsp. europaea]
MAANSKPLVPHPSIFIFLFEAVAAARGDDRVLVCEVSEVNLRRTPRTREATGVWRGRATERAASIVQSAVVIGEFNT